MKEVRRILQDYFLTVAESSNKERAEQRVTTPREIRHHYHHDVSRMLNPIPLIVFPPAASQVTIIQSGDASEQKKRKQNEEKDDVSRGSTTALKVAAVVMGVGASFLGTYVMATDEYVNYYLSNLEQTMTPLREILRSEGGSDTKLRNFIDTYQEWKDKFEKRTKPKVIAKVTSAVSIVTGAGGIFVASTMVALTGVVGATASGCYLLWKHLTVKKRSEDEAFEQFQLMLKELLNREEQLDEEEREAEGEEPGQRAEGQPQPSDHTLLVLFSSSATNIHYDGY